MKTTSKIMIWCLVITFVLNTLKEFSPSYYEFLKLENIRFGTTFILCVLLVFGGKVDKRKNIISKIESEDFSNE